MVDYNKLLTGSPQPPVNMSILTPQMIAGIAGQSQSGQADRLSTIMNLAKMPGPPRMHSVLVDGKQYEVTEDHLAPLLQAGASLIGQKATAGLKGEQASQVKPLAESLMGRRTSQTKIEQQKADTEDKRADIDKRYKGALQAESAARTAEIAENAKAERYKSAAIAANAFVKSRLNAVKRNNYMREFRDLQDLQQSLIDLRKAQELNVGKVNPALIDKERRDQLTFGAKMSTFVSDPEVPVEAKKELIVGYNSLAKADTGVYIKEAVDRWGPIPNSAAKVIHVNLPGKMTMDDVRAAAIRNNMTNEEVLEYIDNKKNKE